MFYAWKLGNLGSDNQATTGSRCSELLLFSEEIIPHSEKLPKLNGLLPNCSLYKLVNLDPVETSKTGSDLKWIDTLHKILWIRSSSGSLSDLLLDHFQRRSSLDPIYYCIV